MIKSLIVVVLLLASVAVQADTYQMTFGWTDSTTYISSDTPTYEAKYRVAGGAETLIPGLPTPGGAATVTANPADAIEVSVRAGNQGLFSAWTAWVTATAPYPATQPGTQTSLTITITHTGP